jgi:hypothetical protein
LKTSVLPFLITAVMALPAHAQIYKWTDANGKIQYSDSPPASSRANASVVKTAPAPETAGKEPSWEEKDREYRSRKAQQNSASRAEESPAERSSAQQCSEARARIAQFNGRMIYRLDKNGERVFVEDSERATIEKNARDTIARHCAN